MIIGDILDLVSREKRMKTRKRTMLRLIIGIGAAVTTGIAVGTLLTLKVGRKMQKESEPSHTIDAIKNTVRNKADDVQDIMESAGQEAENAIKTVCEKTENIKEDLHHGYHKVKKDIDKTAEGILEEFAVSP